MVAFSGRAVPVSARRFPETALPVRGSCALLLMLALCAPGPLLAGDDELRAEIERAAAPVGGSVGVAVWVPGDGEMLTINGDGHYPMQSVYKFPLALAVLDRVDRGELSLAQDIHLTGRDLRPDTWSPLREKYPGGDVSLSLGEVLRYTVSLSDNNGCDVLFRLIGGPDVVNDYVHGLGIADIAIVATEEEMQRSEKVQFQNWSSPVAMAQLLEVFYTGEILSTESRAFLWNVMADARTGSRRIRGGVPEGTVVAHKSGSSGMDGNGVAAATNDVGIVMLPDGRYAIIVAFIENSSADDAVRDAAIAGIARAVWAAAVPQRQQNDH